MWDIFRKVKRTFERSLPVTGHVRLEVRSESGDVAVREGADGVVRVRGRIWISGPRDEVREVLEEIERHPPVEQTGSTLRVGDLPSRPEWDNCSIGFDWWIEAPGDTELQVEVDSGDVKVTGLCGPVVTRVDSGDVEVARIEGDLEVQVEQLLGARLHSWCQVGYTCQVIRTATTPRDVRSAGGIVQEGPSCAARAETAFRTWRTLYERMPSLVCLVVSVPRTRLGRLTTQLRSAGTA